MEVIARKGLAESTGEAYWHWVERYLYFHWNGHGDVLEPEELAERHVEEYLTYLAVKRNVSPSTQNQAFSGILFLYRNVLGIELRGVQSLRSKPCEYIPVVLSAREVAAILSYMRGDNELVAQIQYGSGLRVGEAVSLRIKDIDIDRKTITVRQAKGKKDRFTVLPDGLVESINRQIERVRRWYELDVKQGFACIELPYAFSRKSSNSSASFGWYFLFSSHRRSRNPKTGNVGRHHIDKGNPQRAIKRATEKAGITKHVTSHTLRHSFATHLLESGESIETVRDLLGHDDIRTTQVYLHAVRHAHTRVKSPLAKILANPNTSQHSTRVA